MGDASRKAETRDPLIGRTVHGRFEILELIARGGMGRVYKARQEPLGREVAIKVLGNQGAQDPEFQARFFLEASISAKLSHPNTVTVFDYGKTDDDVYFIAMEYVSGRTLSAVLKEEGPLDPQRAVSIAVQIARSVREAHGLGVIHCDLKPANVLLTNHGDEAEFVKVLDFGLVKKVAEEDELTHTGLFMGSPKYMSPEQIQGADVDCRTDIYALGVILYSMLAGQLPFERASQVQVLMAHMREAVPPLVRQDGVPVPQGIERVVMRCLSKDPDARFASMDELLVALRHACGEFGMSIETSGAYSLGRALAPPKAPHPRAAAVEPGGAPPNVLTASCTGVDDFDVGAVGDDPAPAKSGPLLWAALVVLALIGGAAAVVASSGRATRTSPAPTNVEAPTRAPTGRRAPRASSTKAPAASSGTPAASPGAEEPANVWVVLRSQPEGAEVFVGEQAYGTTPATIEWVGEPAERGREVTFRFEREGFEPVSVTRTIDGERLEVSAELVPLL